MSPLPAGLRWILFDAGGTLVHIEYRYLSEEMAAAGIAAPASQIDWEAAEAEARRWIQASLTGGGLPGDAWDGFFARLLGAAGVDAAAVPALVRRLWERNLATGLWHRPAEGAADLLARLTARGFRMAVISNSEGNAASELNKAGLLEPFEFVIDSHLVGVEKPDPRIFSLALERAGAAASEAAYVGDLYGVDVAGARAAGLAAVLVDPWDLQAGADCPRIRRLSELDALLRTS